MDDRTSSSDAQSLSQDVATGSAAIPNSRELDFLLPHSLTRSLWRSLLANFRDRFFPEKLPRLLLISRPVDTGMLVADILSLPWYRTVFTNLGNVIAPETLPPLELESRPVDVGELISDQLGHLWWTSLLRNLADRIAPEHLPPLQLTSTPVDASLPSESAQFVRWSSLISLPRGCLLDRPRAAEGSPQPAAASTRATISGAAGVQPASLPAASPPASVHGTKLQRELSRSRLREAVLIAIAVLESLYLIAAFLGLL